MARIQGQLDGIGKRDCAADVRRPPECAAPGRYRFRVAINGILDAYDLKTGDEIYRQRLPYIGSGYSASPVAADGKIYLSSEDGEMIVVRAGRTFEHLATNSMGETLMATPALSERSMYVRGAANIFAVGQTRQGRR